MDDSQLKYYFPPDLSKPNNLSVNYDKYITRDPMVDEHIDALLDGLIGIRDREDQQIKKEEDEVSETTVKGDGDDSKPISSGNISGSSSKGSATRADFICYRGILTKIMCTPYSRNEPWELRATLYKGTIYIEESVTLEKRKLSHGTNDRLKLMSYWGYRFETICNISKPVSELRRTKIRKRVSKSIQDSDRLGNANSSTLLLSEHHQQEGSQPSHKRSRLELELSATTEVSSRSSGSNDGGGDNDNDDEGEEYSEEIDLQDPELIGRLEGTVDTNLQYCTIARTKIGRNSIIMGAEVDCISEPKRPAPFNPLSHYIELKTSRIIGSDRERNNFEKHKLLKFWAQSFLPGIPTIIVGFRDDDGNVVTVETFKTMEIPRLVRGKDGAWDSTICINFLDRVFDFLRKLIVIDDPEVTYSIRWAAPFKAIEVEYEGKKNAFLTKRFLNRWGRP
ncbi:hypothetical protein BGX27_008235 [Mortierella sp. AM989]|nr:hypothetical protein BGX27_008235 [Mortierella sp. AM989]